MSIQYGSVRFQAFENDTFAVEKPRPGHDDAGVVDVRADVVDGPVDAAGELVVHPDHRVLHRLHVALVEVAQHSVEYHVLPVMWFADAIVR